MELIERQSYSAAPPTVSPWMRRSDVSQYFCSNLLTAADLHYRIRELSASRKLMKFLNPLPARAISTRPAIGHCSPQTGRLSGPDHTSKWMVAAEFVMPTACDAGSPVVHLLLLQVLVFG